MFSPARDVKKALLIMQNAVLHFSRVVKAKQQVVSGILHHLTVEVIEEGKKKLYEAKVLVQAWLNSKKLHEFNPISDSPSVTPADLGVKRGINAQILEILLVHFFFNVIN